MEMGPGLGWGWRGFGGHRSECTFQRSKEAGTRRSRSAAARMSHSFPNFQRSKGITKPLLEKEGEKVNA